MSRKQKLELTWIGKDERPRLEPRILLEEPALSHHAAHRVGDADRFDNLLIQGDNLLALKALEQQFRGQVKCIYIDPPFNTGEAFEHYDDGLEHSLWLSMMRNRIEILRDLLAPDGTLFIHIDDNELAYLIVICDEIFGRQNRINIVTFKQSSASGPKAINPGLVTTCNYLVFYARDKGQWRPNRIYQPVPRDSRYSSYIENFENHFSSWKLCTLREAFSRSYGRSWSDVRAKLGERVEEELTKFVLRNSERVVQPALIREKDINADARKALIASQESPDEVFRSVRDGKEDYFFLAGKQLLFYKNKVRLIGGKETSALAASNIWDDLLSNNVHQEGFVYFPKGKKPEALLERVLSFSSNPGDLVLDSFAGSGTTGAVAHKMGRRWIMVELGEHCHTHIVPRLRKVIDNEDPGGVTAATGWQGGGGFRYYRLAPSLLREDAFGNLVINPEYRAEMLAEAVCKLMGFTYAPSDQRYWQHGQASESDFLYVTTAALTHEQLRALSEEVGPERTLLVCCKAFRAKAHAFDNLTIQKIPQTVLDRCEWGRDDYSLRIIDLPSAPEQAAAAPSAAEPSAGDEKPARGRKRKRQADTTDLFGGDAT